jgi:hypothetical protein
MRSFTNSFVQLHFDILFGLVCLLFPAIFTMCFYLQNILMILIPKTILIGYFPSKSIKVFRKIGWSSIPSKFIKVRQSFWPKFLMQVYMVKNFVKESFDKVFDGKLWSCKRGFIHIQVLEQIIKYLGQTNT